MTRRASAFAPAKSGGGHLDWEGAGTTCWSTIENVFPLVGNTYPVACDGSNVDYQTRGLILIPLNEARGTVTLLRVRGFLGILKNEQNGTSQTDVRNGTVHFMLQLVPRDPDVVTTPDAAQLLSGNKAADQESNRIIMQWVATAGLSMHGSSETEGAAAPVGGWAAWFREIDVKTKRRFHRAQWALIFSATGTVASFDNVNRVYLNTRMLFRADDGI